MIRAAFAPGWPGIAPRWTSSAKVGVGSALGLASRVWFTLSHGILNEVYYSRVDQACIRDLGLVVTDGQEFFSEEKRHTHHQVAVECDGCPAYLLTNSCERSRYRLEKLVLSDPWRPVVLQQVRFVPLQGNLGDYHLYVLLAPHLGNRGSDNTAWVGSYKGVSMLFARRAGSALALACTAPWLNRSAGFVGASDGWQDLVRHRQMTWLYQRAENGNVALTGEVDLVASAGFFTLALGFGLNANEAGQRVRSSMLAGFELSHDEYVRQWQGWQSTLLPPPTPSTDGRDLYRTSTMVMRVHQEKRFLGGIIASLSVPWGFSKGDNDLGGYHLLWPRDLVETAVGLLAAGAAADARLVLDYLHTIQEEDGHWPQNTWLDGTPYWTAVQMDETALPILLVDQLRRYGKLSAAELAGAWPMVRLAAGYLVRNGPVTQQDRWEEDPGYAPFTLAAEVAALLAAADLAELCGEPALAPYLRETADSWNECIERWSYVRDTTLTAELGVDGYYVRIAPPEMSDGASVKEGFVPIKNRPPGENLGQASFLISPDALALVRFGLRAPDDPRIVNTVKVIDAVLKVETPYGPAWRRYNGDGYGEHADGRPFDGTGIGRAWPLLVGERALYELAAGRRDTALQLLRTMEAFADPGGMIPEQVWDAPDIPQHGLYCGRPTGSAMPLVWAHAEYVKLRRSLEDNAVFDTPPQPVRRYQVEHAGSPYFSWRFNNKPHILPAGDTLRVEVLAPAVVRWSADGWQAAHDAPTRDTGLGVHLADLPTRDLPPGAQISLTFYWPEVGRWEGVDFAVRVEGAEAEQWGIFGGENRAATVAL